MKKNASNIEGFLTADNKRKRVTLDKAEPAKSQAKNGLLPNQEREPLSKRSKKSNRKQSESDDWANDIDTVLADLPGYDNLETSDFVDNKKDAKKALRKKTPKKDKKKLSKKKKILITVFVILALLIGGILTAIWLIWPSNSFQGNWWDALTSERLKEDENGRTNILLFGTAPVDFDGPLLSDTIMVLSVNQDDKSAYMVSLSRDLWVKHYCPNEALGTTEGKLNETYRCALENDDLANDSKAGEEFQKKVGEVLGLDVQYYTHLSWDSVIDVVNAVGGIDVTIESSNPKGIYDVATGINFKNGETVHMDGHLALAFIRARNSAGGYGLEDSNFARERHQQLVLQALQKKASDIGTLTNPVTVVNSFQALGDNVRTNFRVGELRTLANLANEIDTNTIVSLPLLDADKEIELVTTDTIYGASVVVPSAGTFDYSEIKRYINMSMSSNPIVREGAVIDVLNGSDVEGLASIEAKKLEEEGFNIGKISNVPEVARGKTVIYQLTNDKTATIEALEQNYKVSTASMPFSYYTDADFVMVLMP